METNQISATALPRPSIDELDLSALPDRLDDQTWAMVREIANSPLPPQQTSDETHFSQCLRVMDAALPRRTQGELGGELFYNIYRRQLARFPNEAISYLADVATRTCRWFPTIAECLDILGGWRRNDEAARRKIEAMRIANREASARLRESNPQPEPIPEMTQAGINAMPLSLRKIGLTLGHITQEQFDAAGGSDGEDDGGGEQADVPPDSRDECGEREVETRA